MTETGLTTTPPRQLMEGMQQAATVVPQLLSMHGMTTQIPPKSGTRYILIDGWYAIGGIAGVTVVTESVEVDKEANGYRATVAAMRGGELLTRAVAICSHDERTRDNRRKFPEVHAACSMAQTRAAAKALRMALGPLVAMSGADIRTTPAEEMDDLPIEQPIGPRVQPEDPAKYPRRPRKSPTAPAKRVPPKRQLSDTTRWAQIMEHAAKASWTSDKDSEATVSAQLHLTPVKAATGTPNEMQIILIACDGWQALAKRLAEIANDDAEAAADSECCANEPTQLIRGSGSELE